MAFMTVIGYLWQLQGIYDSYRRGLGGAVAQWLGGNRAELLRLGQLYADGLYLEGGTYPPPQEAFIK